MTLTRLRNGYPHATSLPQQNVGFTASSYYYFLGLVDSVALLIDGLVGGCTESTCYVISMIVCQGIR